MSQMFIQTELQKVVLYCSLSAYYEFTQPELHRHYDRLYGQAVCRLAELVAHYGDPFGMAAAVPYGAFPGGMPPMSIGMAAPGMPMSLPGSWAPRSEGPGGAAPVEMAQLRFLHASPDAPAVNIFVDGHMLVSDLTFRKATAYVPVPAGHHSVEVRLSASPDTVVLTGAASLDPGGVYTAAVGGKAAAPMLLVLNDGPVPGPEASRVRFLHLSPDAPAVDIAVKDGAVLVQNVGFGAHSDYVEVPAAPVDLEVRAAGTATKLFLLPGVTPAAGGAYTLTAVGLVNGEPGLSVLLLSDVQ